MHLPLFILWLVDRHENSDAVVRSLHSSIACTGQRHVPPQCQWGSFVACIYYTISKSDTNTITLYHHTRTTKVLTSAHGESLSPALSSCHERPSSSGLRAAVSRCERVFSSCTLRRNRISPQLLEALQILKFALRKDRLNFTGELLAREEDYNIDLPRAVEELIGEGKFTGLDELVLNTSDQ